MLPRPRPKKKMYKLKSSEKKVVTPDIAKKYLEANCYKGQRAKKERQIDKGKRRGCFASA